MIDACIGTEELKLPPATVSSTKNEQKLRQSNERSQAGVKEKKIDMESIEKQGTGSTDILSSFIIFFFSSIFSLLWFIFMIPVRISKIAITLMLVVAIYQIVWTLLADYEVTALIDMNYNTY
jgi:hypothetical protein